MISLQVIFLAGVAMGIVGALLSYVGIRDPYSEVGHGPLALDVRDSVPPPPLDSSRGQVEVQQLLDAIEAVRGERQEDAQ
jgi:hypothetical protein